MDQNGDTSESGNVDVKNSDTEETEFEAGRGVYSLDRTSFGDRFLDSWTDMRASTRRLLREKPSEARIVLYVLASDIVFFISWSLKTTVAPASGAEALISPDKIGLFMIGALMLRTAVLYIFSAVVHVFARLCKGNGSWKDTRTGMFWGAFVSAPFGLLAAIISVFLTYLEPQFPALKSEWLALPVYWLGLIPFVWLISAGVAEANGFRMTSPTFMVMSVVALVLTVMALLYGQGGMVG